MLKAFIIVTAIITPASGGFDFGKQTGTNTEWVQFCTAKCHSKEYCMKQCLLKLPKTPTTSKGPRSILQQICDKHPSAAEALCDVLTK